MSKTGKGKIGKLKVRNPFVVDAINRKAGPMKDRRKKREKQKASDDLRGEIEAWRNGRD